MKEIIIVVGSNRKKGNTDLFADVIIKRALELDNNINKISFGNHKQFRVR